MVPTWNYVEVHAYGTLRIHDDPRWLWQQIEALTRQQEARYSHLRSLADAPAEYIDKLLQGIVGVDMVIECLTGRWKVSQNQPLANRIGSRSGLLSSESQAEAEMATLITTPGDSG